MDFLSETKFIERLQFFNGQRLFASDIQGLEAFNREMRWLHNQSLHQPGIGNGFAVFGKKGDREILIKPGYATDIDGKEILLTQPHIEPVPPVSSDEGRPVVYDLTISYPPDENLEETETRKGICLDAGVIRRKEEPVFCWVRLTENGNPENETQKQEIHAGLKIVLARAEILNCKLHQDISIAQRLSARPAKEPYLCCGEIEPAWEPFIIAPIEVANVFSVLSHVAPADFFKILMLFPFLFPIGLKVTINTSECGFLTTPCYSARIAGPRFLTFDLKNGNLEIKEKGGDINLIVDGFVQILDPKPNQFTMNVILMMQLLISNIDALIILATFLGSIDPEDPNFEKNSKHVISRFFSSEESCWKVVWMGVEG